MINKRPLITVKEARRFLGKDARDMDDVEVMEVVTYLHEMAKEYLRKKSVKTSNNRLGLENGLSKSGS